MYGIVCMLVERLKEAEDKAVQRQGDIQLLQEQYEDNKKKLQREVKLMKETLEAR